MQPAPGRLNQGYPGIITFSCVIREGVEHTPSAGEQFPKEVLTSEGGLSGRVFMEGVSHLLGLPIPSSQVHFPTSVFSCHVSSF